MSVYRKNLITNDWVIFAPNRASRPHELKGHEVDNVDLLAERPAYRETCPFCRGNEKPEDAEELVLPRTDGGWGVRVMQNKFASVGRDVKLSRRHEGLHREMEGFGIHDVIIDHPEHNTTIALMKHDDVRLLVGAYQQRYEQIRAHPDVRHVVIFKNQGIKAGGSLEHPHSQIYGLPVLPFDTMGRLKEEEKYFEFNNQCLMCDILKDELDNGSRVVYENPHFVCVSPFAALSPYHLWIVPKRHAPSFSLATPGELDAFAECLRIVLRKVYGHLRNPDYNFIIQSLARFEKESDFYHWYLSFIPHVKTKGGLETAGGMYINPVMPEDAAAALRNYLP